MGGVELSTQERLDEPSALGVVAEAEHILRSENQAEPEPPAVLAVSAAAQEQAAQASYRRFLGQVALHRIVEVPEAEPAQVPTLLEAINMAVFEKDREAERMVDINIATAVSEAYFKKMHRTEVSMERNADGEVVQFGQTKRQINLNSIIYRPNRDERLQQYTQAEALNACREEELLKTGALRDYILAVPSLVPDQLPEELLDHRGDGYFTSSMSFCLQGTTEKQGRVYTESIFDEGTAASDTVSFEERNRQRFDVKALQALYKRFGLPVPDGPLGFLQNPFLIHKSMTPNGMVDILRMVHEAADAADSRLQCTRPPEEYTSLQAKSKEREDSLEDVRQEVKTGLFAMAGSFKDPMEPVQKMWDLIKQTGVRAAATNTHIDPMAFGRSAAEHIQQARYYAATEDFDAMNMTLDKAEAVATISGCGGGSDAKKGDSGGAGDEVGGSAPGGAHHYEDKYGSLEFRCQKGHTNLRPPNVLIPRCKVCGISVRC